ncbi:MAG: hypothetical protein A4E51_00911 [Methanosaeta sp. PtaU1.Bin055]|nr:MAG: hypothetical protein A4E51_00911 [Methanosaeta sp. PtaU1.Bin055]
MLDTTILRRASSCSPEELEEEIIWIISLLSCRLDSITSLAFPELRRTRDDMESSMRLRSWGDTLLIPSTISEGRVQSHRRIISAIREAWSAIRSRFVAALV